MILIRVIPVLELGSNNKNICHRRLFYNRSCCVTWPTPCNVIALFGHYKNVLQTTAHFLIPVPFTHTLDVDEEDSSVDVGL